MKRKLRTIVRWTLIVLALVLGGGYLGLHFWYNNQALARRITDDFNRDRRGRLEIERVHWGPGALWSLATGKPTRLTVTNLRLRDSRGRVALAVPRAEIDLRPRALLGPGNIAIRSIRVREGWVAWDRYRRPDGPDASGDASEIGLLGALEPRPRRGVAPPPPDEPPSKTPSRPPALRYVAIHGLDLAGLTVRLSDRGTEAILSEVSLRGDLRHATGGGRPDVLVLDLRAMAPRGVLRVGHREVAISSLTLSARSGVGAKHDALVLSGRLRAAGGRIALEGQLRGIPTAPFPALRLTLRAQRFGPLLQQLGFREIQEDGSRLRLSLRGDTALPRAEAHLSGLGWGTDQGAPRLIRATVTYRGGVVRIESALARVWDGDCHLVGWLTPAGLDWGLDAQVLSMNAPWLLRRHMHEVDLEISGIVHGTGSLHGARRSQIYLTLAATRRSEASPLPRMLTMVGWVTANRTRLQLRQISAWSELGVLMASGWVDLPRRHLDLKLRLRTWSLRAHLRPLGYRPYIDGVALQGRLYGPDLDPTFLGRLELLDFRTDLLHVPSLRSPVTLIDGEFVAADLRSPRYGRYLRASARLNLYQASLRHLQRLSLEFDWSLGPR